MTTPGYPVYQIGTLFAGGVSHFVPLTRDNDFLAGPNRRRSRRRGRPAKIFFLNYPNNPTAPPATSRFLPDRGRLCRKHEHRRLPRRAYSELASMATDRPPVSRGRTGGKADSRNSIPLDHQNLQHDRLAPGHGGGQPRGLAALGKIKSNIDSGAFDAIQSAGIAALDSDQSCVRENCAILQERRDILVGGLQKLGYDATPPRATFYVWLPVPQGLTSMGFTTHLLEQAGIVTIPGNGLEHPGRRLRAPGFDGPQGAPARSPDAAGEDWLRMLGESQGPTARPSPPSPLPTPISWQVEASGPGY